MTHVTNFGVWTLWMAATLGVSFDAALMAWNAVVGPANNVRACNAEEGAFIWSYDLARELPTCPHCAVLCDMARGAE